MVGEQCVRCGSGELRPNGQCAPCHRASSTAWKAKEKARRDESGEPRFYTYIHLRADDGKVFYVGKGIGRRATTDKDRNEHWRRVKAKHGIRIEVVARWHTEQEAFDHERELIRHYRDNGAPLCNYTDGGDGISGYRHTAEARARFSEIVKARPPASTETRRKISAAGLGRVVPQEQRERTAAKNRGRKHTKEQIRINSECHRGIKQTAETIAKRAAKMKGHPVSAETRAKIGAGNTGKKHPPEFGARVSAMNKGRIRSPEFKAKIVAALTGRPCSEETRRKISQAHKGRSPSPEMRARISQTLMGRKLSAEEKARRYSLQHGPEIRAKRKAAFAQRRLLLVTHRSALAEIARRRAGRMQC